MRRIKLALYTVLTVVVLAIIGGAVFSLFFNLNSFKPTLAQAAFENTGRKLTIDGDITVSLFPLPRARQNTKSPSPPSHSGSSV